MKKETRKSVTYCTNDDYVEKVFDTWEEALDFAKNYVLKNNYELMGVFGACEEDLPF